MVLVPQRGMDGAVERVLAIMYEVTQQHLVRRISERVIHSGTEVEACRHIAAGLVGEMSIAVATLWLYRSGGEGVYAAAHAEEGAHAPGDGSPGGDAAGPSAPDWLAEAEATRGTLVRDPPGAARAPLGLVVTVVAPILGPQGPIGFIEVGTTTRYPSEQALPTALERLAEQYAQFDARYRAQRTFEAVFSRTPDAVALLSASGEVRFANESAQRLFGARATHVDRMFVEPAAVHDLIARAVACADASTPLRSDVQALDRDDRAFTAEIAFSRVAVAPGAAGSGIALVARDLTERNAMQASLERSLREKDTLLREVHHRVKNNLQIVSSLLAMQADGLDDAVSGRALASSVERVFAMSLVHQHLYDGDNFERIDLGGYAQGLVARLRATAGQPAHLAFDFDLEEVWVGLDQAVPLGLLLHELLTNAIKHGGDADGARRISLGLHRSASGFSLSIADRGSTPLTAGAPLRSLGLQLVRALCRQLAARLVIDARTDGPGTRVTVHVPG
jgi:two-component sensor histidine kinase/PAS domain-containing protein